MHLKTFFKRFIIAIVCVIGICGASYAAGNIPDGDIGEYGAWINQDNMDKYKTTISNDINKFQQDFETNIKSPTFVPLEVKLGFAFLKALYAIDAVLQLSLVRFTIIFLFVMYAFWIGLEAYKMIREATDYKTVFYSIFKKGIIISVWVLILFYGPAKIFTMLIGPIMSVGTYLSNFILDTIAKTYNINIPDTCATIHQYADTQTGGKLLIDANAAADIMCVPGRISTYFYHATSMGFKWMINGFAHGITMIVIGAVCVFVFIKCIFKYAFMTLGVIADLFLRLLMLPFTAIAEAMPKTSETNYVGQIFSGLLKIFNADKFKLSDTIAAFINATIYFVSLSLVIAICAMLLSKAIDLNSDNAYSLASGMTSLLTGCLVLYLANKSDEFAKKIGGSIDNSFGKTLQGDAKTLAKKTTDLGAKIFKAWSKK